MAVTSYAKRVWYSDEKQQMNMIMKHDSRHEVQTSSGGWSLMARVKRNS
jgi:hypothetical protein